MGGEIEGPEMSAVVTDVDLETGKSVFFSPSTPPKCLVCETMSNANIAMILGCQNFRSLLAQ